MTNELLLDVLTDVVLIIHGALRVRVNVRIRLGIELGLCYMFTFVCAIIFNLSNNAIVVCCCRLLCKA